MCGIAGVHRRGDANIPKLGILMDELLLAIEGRGRDATGYLALMDDGRVQLEKTCRPARQFIQRRGRILGNARTVLLHTRYATRGDKKDPRNAHPVASGTIAAVHNGTIYNADEIFDAFKLPRRAKVDSEVIPALIDYAGWDHAKDAADLFQGGAAFAAVNTERPQEVLLGRTESYPMVYMVTKDIIVFASTRKAIDAAWHHTYGRPIPKSAKWVELGRWEMARINGKVERIQIREAPPEPPRAKLAQNWTPPTRTKAAKKAAKKARRSGRDLEIARDVATAYGRPIAGLVRRYDQDDNTAAAIDFRVATMDDLMADGWSRKEAEDFVYSGALWDPDEDDWGYGLPPQIHGTRLA